MEKSVFYDELQSLEILEEAADNAAYTGAGVDMQGFEGVAFLAHVKKGEVAAITLKAQQDTSADFDVDPQDLAGTSVSVATTVADDGIAVLDIGKPTDRYVRAVLTVPDLTTARGACVVAVRYRADKVPVGNAGEFHLSPAEGTA